MSSKSPSRKQRRKSKASNQSPNTTSEGVEEGEVSTDAISIDGEHIQTAAQSPPDTKDMSSKSEEKVHRVKIEHDRTGWSRLSDLIRQYDRDRVEDVKEDIDTLLVFAGLFSAVITAFIVESYKTLQQQPEDTTNQILLQLSAQLASLTLSGNFVNSTIPMFTSPSFVPTRFSVLVNTLWLLSLVVALITASLGILVKQWLHELMARDTQDPCQQVKIRFFREVGVQRWQVFEIAAALPVLLQLALLLFFIGLSAFLHNLNLVVAWVVTGVMIIWLVFYVFMTIAPVFSSQCPYKTPILKGLLLQVRVGSLNWLQSLTRFLWDHIPITWHTIKQRCKGLHDLLDTWSAASAAREEVGICTDDTWDLPTLVCSREILRGEQLEETITDCFRSCDVGSLLCCLKLVAQGDGPDVRGVLPDVPQGMTHETCDLFLSRVGDLGHVPRNPVYLSQVYLRMTYALVNSYDSDPVSNFPVSRVPLAMLVRLISENQTSAVYSVLTIYSVRYHTLENHPDHFDVLFPIDDERQMYDIGTQFVLNLVVATRAICHGLWNQSQVDPDLDIQSILHWITRLRTDSDPSIPTNPIALTSTFATVLYSLIPPGVRVDHRDMILEVMGELGELVADGGGGGGGLEWGFGWRQSVEFVCGWFREMGLVDGRLVPRLEGLINTW
ncbi:hypothetical protein QCA50_002581 [Cerrena zonata]|uniref:DUF6535 domain-containing protein n=1 Tax=Cerrena zonata TaxID=2478898 RepID=A0AAW0GUA7_9APHY